MLFPRGLARVQFEGRMAPVRGAAPISKALEMSSSEDDALQKDTIPWGFLQLSGSFWVCRVLSTAKSHARSGALKPFEAAIDEVTPRLQVALWHPYLLLGSPMRLPM